MSDKSNDYWAFSARDRCEILADAIKSLNSRFDAIERRLDEQDAMVLLESSDARLPLASVQDPPEGEGGI